MDGNHFFQCRCRWICKGFDESKSGRTAFRLPPFLPALHHFITRLCLDITNILLPNFQHTAATSLLFAQRTSSRSLLVLLLLRRPLFH